MELYKSKKLYGNVICIGNPREFTDKKIQQDCWIQTNIQEPVTFQYMKNNQSKNLTGKKIILTVITEAM